jgi:hypothetical protein
MDGRLFTYAGEVFSSRKGAFVRFLPDDFRAGQIFGDVVFVLLRLAAA